METQNSNRSAGTQVVARVEVRGTNNSLDNSGTSPVGTIYL
jgi:hypothetical protein